MSGIRKAIAKAMVNSKHTAPHVTLMDEVDVTELVAHRKKFKAVAADKGIKLTYLPYVVKALTSALREYPMLNTSLDDASQEVVHKHYFNIGIAADTDKGLLVPVVKDTDRKSIFTISNEINDLAGKAREGRLAPAEMKGASCTITNIGSAGGQWFTPVINHPEVAILGIGRIAEKPVVKNGEIVAAPVLALSLSFDHRLIDGATAQKALNQIKRLLNDPQLLVMEVITMVVGDFPIELDTVVVGAGPGGYVAAIRAAQLGQKVAIIEKANLGGVCLNVGCIPSKALINAGHRYENAMHSDDMGITAENVKVDFTKVQEWKNGVVKKLTGGVEGLLKGNKVEIIRGEAYFVDANTLRVMTEDAAQTYTFKNAVLATGSTPIEIPGFKYSKRVINSTGALSLPEIPKNLL